MATNQRGHFPYEGEIGVGQPVSILPLTDTPSYIPVGTPQSTEQWSRSSAMGSRGRLVLSATESAASETGFWERAARCLST